MKISIFWDIAPCSPYMNRRFGRKYLLHLQDRKSAEQETSERRRLGSLTFFPRLIFDHEDGGGTFLRNFGSYTDYTALYPRRWQFLLDICFHTFSNILAQSVTLLSCVWEMPGSDLCRDTCYSDEAFRSFYQSL
jgi:hypothetical protein